ncbi:hypothetical protein PG994_006231 [Apiospora phragmitis]|uniref:Uncharacterized protein n=1 Tax=Apiospora phragmitis TaxID=2905665 RepID=A0ABR1VEH7_9PEZI
MKCGILRDLEGRSTNLWGGGTRLFRATTTAGGLKQSQEMEDRAIYSLESVTNVGYSIMPR